MALPKLGVKKGDRVRILSGKDKGKEGKILEVFLKKGKVVVEGINMKKKHVRPKKSGEKGQIVRFPAPLHISNVKLICRNCGKPTRIGFKIVNKKKYRICKKCGQAI